MKQLTLGDIAEACNGQYIGDKSKLATAVKNVVIDSRLAQEGSLFVAIKGERTDGHLYIEKAYKLGAVCAISEQVMSADNPYILVRSSEQAIKDIAEYYRSLFCNIEVVGITGSVGKTSTKEMIAAVLSREFVVHKTQGNFNNELGVPLTLLSMPEDTEVAVVEMGISDFGEMTRLSKMVRPTVCVLTNIGCCHLENLKDRDGVLKAKTEMFSYKEEDALIFVNGDDDKLAAVENVTATYGLGEQNDYHAENIQNNGENSVSCTICFDGKKLDVTIPALGNYMVANALGAAAVGKALNMSDENIVKGIADYTTVGSRANLISTEVIRIIDDCYNANPTSVKAAIETLCNIRGGRKVAVLGDMKELGENEISLHAEVGEHAAKCGVDVLI
ncbi:MAG: UDP-N-acetylmuramoyl-tripeptide--D-alanyl-D-alanine ligase, partial [Clostridia bacterium]|nr:UDP-N-acetylmuramoyl-tripeptide--D-alanyl-D-alanine ligase [Clostridia bacterium]